MLPFRVQIQDGLPVSDQLIRSAQRAILAGELADGAIFPSVRALGKQLKISPTTAHKVVLELKNDGFLVSRPGVGMVVVKPEGPAADTLIENLLPVCEALLQQATQLGLSTEDAIKALRRAAAKRKP
jgi:GntR family transcriptional regulator